MPGARLQRLRPCRAAWQRQRAVLTGRVRSSCRPGLRVRRREATNHRQDDLLPIHRLSRARRVMLARSAFLSGAGTRQTVCTLSYDGGFATGRVGSRDDTIDCVRPGRWDHTRWDLRANDSAISRHLISCCSVAGIPMLSRHAAEGPASNLCPVGLVPSRRFGRLCFSAPHMRDSTVGHHGGRGAAGQSALV